MTEAVDTQNGGATGGATGSSTYTDEQLAAAFPNQDLAHVRAMMDKKAGVGANTSPNADGDNNGGANDQQTGQPVVEYPDYIPEKFRVGTVEEAHRRLAESYAVIERARGAGAGSVGAGDAGAGGESGGEAAGGDTGDAGTAAQLDLKAVEAEWIASNGKLSDGTYEQAKAAGMEPAVLDAYISGQQALAQQLVTKVHTLAGGEEAYSSMLQWAGRNWSPEEVTAFDQVMHTGDMAAISLAVRGLKADYKAVNGSAPNLKTGDGDVAGNPAGFKSKAEMTAAMRDPRYKKDPAYRAEVARKIHAGNVWGAR